jgi:multidrug efflux pump subunit AcrB
MATQESSTQRVGVAGKIAQAFLESKLTPLLVVASLLLGALGLLVTPREEEPQIAVPMIDVFVGLPGASAEEVERRVIEPLERALAGIEGVEYLYATSQPSGGMLIVRFLVGRDPDEAVLRVHAKVAEVLPELPADVIAPQVVARSIDDVPVVAWTFFSTTTEDVGLRDVVSQVASELGRDPRVARTEVIGGGRRAITIELDQAALAARGLSPLEVVGWLEQLDRRLPAGTLVGANQEVSVLVGSRWHSAVELEQTVIGAGATGAAVRLGDVARVIDGDAETHDAVWVVAGAAGSSRGLPANLDAPAVTLWVAKKPGVNAIDLVANLDARLEGLKGTLIPPAVGAVKTRDYGFTADEKSSELVLHLWIATLAVVILMAFALGRREALVVLVAVPTTLALTLAASYFFGYTLNRVTLFALIFAIGILVDDAIVVVENIHRHYLMGGKHPRLATVVATDEVGNPTILATFTVVAALLPLAFVSGLMGPYMRPIPVNASAAMVFSLLVAFVVSPWLTLKLFRRKAEELAAAGAAHGAEEHVPQGRIARAYVRLLEWLLESGARRLGFLAVVLVLLVASMALVATGAVAVKMLPFDDKSEVQVIIDTPEGWTLEATTALARRLAIAAAELPEVTDVEVYAGTSGPFNFNGLVRHYFLRQGANVADLQVNLLPKHERSRASHPFALALREHLRPLVEGMDVSIKVAEVPPGPPVLSTLVAEVYGPDRAAREALAAEVKAIFESTPGVVDVDWYVEHLGPEVDVVVDRDKAALAGIPVAQIAGMLRFGVAGQEVGRLAGGSGVEPVPVLVRLAAADRSHVEDLLAFEVPTRDGRVVPLSELVSVVERPRERFLYRKNQQPVTYVLGEVAATEGGGGESPVYAIFAMRELVAALRDGAGQPIVMLDSKMPTDPGQAAVKWDGEWQITIEVFRDMGIAFAVVLVLIFILVVGWFGSFVTPLVIMAPIPLTLVGILPAHAIGGVYFTATSMIGFIALAGIIVRNSILLVDFVEQERATGTPVRAAVVRAGLVRFRPIALTAAALVAGGVVILLDPIFQGLAVSLIAGVVVATALTLVVIPVLHATMVELEEGRRRRSEA